MTTIDGVADYRLNLNERGVSPASSRHDPLLSKLSCGITIVIVHTSSYLAAADLYHSSAFGLCVVRRAFGHENALLLFAANGPPHSSSGKGNLTRQFQYTQTGHRQRKQASEPTFNYVKIYFAIKS